MIKSQSQQPSNLKQSSLDIKQQQLFTSKKSQKNREFMYSPSQDKFDSESQDKFDSESQVLTPCGFLPVKQTTKHYQELSPNERMINERALKPDDSHNNTSIKHLYQQMMKKQSAQQMQIDLDEQIIENPIESENAHQKVLYQMSQSPVKHHQRKSIIRHNQIWQTTQIEAKPDIHSYAFDYEDSLCQQTLTFLQKLYNIMLQDQTLLAKTKNELLTEHISNIKSYSIKIKQQLYKSIDQFVNQWEDAQLSNCINSKAKYLNADVEEISHQLQQRMLEISTKMQFLEDQSQKRHSNHMLIHQNLKIKQYITEVLSRNYQQEVLALSNFVQKVIDRSEIQAEKTLNTQNSNILKSIDQANQQLSKMLRVSFSPQKVEMESMKNKTSAEVQKNTKIQKETNHRIQSRMQELKQLRSKRESQLHQLMQEASHRT